MSEPLFSFEKLDVYQHACALRVRIYQLSELLPKQELKLKIQMSDAARSLTNNIAEGHGRFNYRDRKRFLVDARASQQELVDDVNLCMEQNYAKSEHLYDLKLDSRELLKKTNGYIKYLRLRENAPSRVTTLEGT